MKIYIYRTSSVVASFNIDKKTLLKQRLFGENVITAVFTARKVLNVSIGDYIVYNNVKYYINSAPKVTKKSSRQYEYSITFEVIHYNVSKVQYMSGDLTEFDLIGDADDFIDLIITNLDRVYGGGVWTKGTVDMTDTSHKLFHFSGENCAQVMMRLSEEFDAEFYFDQQEISFTDEVGSDISLTLKYKTGLFNFIRNTISDKNIITRIFAYGSKKNIDTDYGATRLLPTQVAGEYYQDSNTSNYGIIEHTKIFEDIFPTRTGTISWVDGSDVKIFKDDGMDFDINSYLITGMTAKVHFQTGDLAGYEFEISEYLNGTTQYTIVTSSDRQDFELPNDTLKPAIGDTYKLLDITMPTSYVETAEDLLRDEALIYLNDNDNPRVSYTLTPDWKYLKTNNIEIKIGDFITVEDTELGINTLTRVVRLTRQLINQHKYILELSDNYSVKLVIQKLFSDTEKIKRKLNIDTVGDILKARGNWRTSEELRGVIFDPDDYFDMDNIRPLSIETAMISVGSKSGQFFLKDVTITPNYTGDKAKFRTTAGYLTHFTIDDGATHTWEMFLNDQTGLTDATVYYIYARCHKTEDDNANNKVIVDSAERQVDADATYYYFLIGVLHSVDGGIRAVSGTYGQTTIAGQFINTGVMTAVTIQTASSGQRVIVDGVNNKISLFVGAGAGTERLIIDDNVESGLPGVYMGSGGVFYIVDGGDYASVIAGKLAIEGTGGNTIAELTSTATIAATSGIYYASYEGAVTGNFFIGRLNAVTKFLVDQLGNLDTEGTGNFAGLLTLQSGLAVTGNIAVTGTVDGVDVAAHVASDLQHGHENYLDIHGGITIEGVTYWIEDGHLASIII